MTELKVGMPAPNFTLPDQMGKIHSLSDFRGKKVVLFFTRKTIPQDVQGKPSVSEICMKNICV